MTKRIGIVGARGYVGGELLRLIAAHPQFELAYVTSRELEGQRLADHVDADVGELRYTSPAYEQLPELGADAVVLALPNGKAAHIVQQFDVVGADPVLLDLSADYRFDPSWYYGLPELTRGGYANQRRISNPGCYATAMQLAIAPMGNVLEGPVQCFGVSGYSGAGTSPSDKNNLELLRDNLMPYALTGHVHEREVSKQLVQRGLAGAVDRSLGQVRCIRRKDRVLRCQQLASHRAQQAPTGCGVGAGNRPLCLACRQCQAAHVAARLRFRHAAVSLDCSLPASSTRSSRCTITSS